MCRGGWSALREKPPWWRAPACSARQAAGSGERFWDGRLAKITGNPQTPQQPGKLCSRGHAGINNLYDPDRLLYPLKRSGARGEGKWARHSWEQALEEMAKRFTALRKGDRTEALWMEMGGSGSPELMALEFLKAFGSPVVFSRGGRLGVERPGPDR